MEAETVLESGWRRTRRSITVWWRAFPIGLIVLLALPLTSGRGAQLGSAGNLDTSYGVGGTNTANFGTSPSNAGGYGVGSQKLGANAGKTVIAANLVCDSGGVCQEFALMRLNADGTQDFSFGDGGQAVLHVETHDLLQQGALAMQSDDKIVIVGEANTGSGAEKFIVARFTANGALDTSFAGGTGYFSYQWATFNGGINRAQGVAIQDDGKIVAVGYENNQSGSPSGTDPECVVVRLNSDGTLDTTSFGTGGIAMNNFAGNGGNEQLSAVVISGTGSSRKLIAGGFLPSAGKLLFARYTNDGSLDTSFGTNGISSFSIPNTSSNRVFGLALDSSGNILVSGRAVSGHQQMLTARLTSSGALDTTFNSPNGYQLTFVSDGSGTVAVGQAISVQSDGKIVSGGYDQYLLNNQVTPVKNDLRFMFARFNSNGTYDSSFGSGASGAASNPTSGVVLVNFNTTVFVPTQLHAMTIDSQGRIIGVGERSDQTNNVPPDIAAARLTSDGTLDASFNGGSFHGPMLTGTADEAAGVVIDSSGRAVVGGQTTAGGNGNINLGVARFTTGGVLDTTFNGSGVAAANDPGMTDTGRAVALQSTGKILVVGDSYSQTVSDEFLIVRFTATGSLDTSFGSGGFARVSFGSNASGTPYAVTVDRNDKIILAGSASHDIVLVRLNADGSTDTSFGTGGKATLDLGGEDAAHAILIQPAATAASDKYLVGGTSGVLGTGSFFALARFTANGSLDTSFNGSGHLTTRVTAGNQASPSDDIRALGVLSDGKIVAAGQSINSFGLSASGLARYNANGTLDTSFGTGGVEYLNLNAAPYNSGGTQDEINGLAVQHDDKVVIFGETTSFATNSFGDFITGRINWTDGSVDTTFASNGYVTQGFSSRDFAVGGAILTGAQNGKVLVGGTAGLADYAVVRYLGDPPPTVLAAPDLTAASDSGRSSTDNITNDNTPTFTGTCTMGETVVLRVDGADTSPVSRVLCTGGSYSVTAAAAIPDGTHQMTVLSRNGAGDSSPSSALSVTIDTVANPPVISQPAQNTVQLPDPVISGSGAESLAFVNVYQGSGTTNPVCNTTADSSSGSWSCQSSLNPGSYSISATQTDIAGNTSQPSSPPRSFIVQAPTKTALSSSTPSSVFGQPVTFTALVTSDFSGTPTGTVEFKDGSTDIAGCGSRPLSSGSGGVQATCITSALAVSSSPHTITAIYNGDTYFQTSTSPDLSQSVSKAATSVNVSSSANPSIINNQVTLTAQIAVTSPGSGTPSGTVTFQDNGTPITNCESQTITSGTATCQSSTFGVGTHPITAIYSGDGNFLSSTSSILSQVVNKADISTIVTSSVNPSVSGQGVTFTATLSPVAPGTGVPTGSVTFYDGSTALDTETLGSGSSSVTFATSSLSVGSHTITAAYGGDSTFNPSSASTQPAVTQVVNQAGTTTTVASSLSPSVYGQAVTFTARVSVTSPGSGTPTGTVAFSDGSTTLGTGLLSTSGSVTSATLTISSLTGGPHTITASYGGHSSFASSSGSVSQTVNQASTTTTLASSTNPSVFGQSVTFTATITAPSSAIAVANPTGTVTFSDGNTTLSTGPLTTSGSVTTTTFTTSSLAVGSHTITATYNGDGNYSTSSASAAQAVTQQVNQAGTSTTISSLVNPSAYGQGVTFTATVSVTAPGAGTPTGTVTFSDGSTTLGTGTLNGSGTITLSTVALAVGTHTITATYGGDSNFTGSMGSLTGNPQIVTKANTTTTITGTSPNPSTLGQAVTVQYSVTVNAPGGGTLTGNVTVTDGVDSCTGAVEAGSCSITLTTSGTQTLTATYAGDSNYNGSTSAGVSQTVNKTSTTTAVSSSSATSVFGQMVTFTATVTTASGTPTGTVTFSDGGTTLSTGPLSLTGTATLSTSSLTGGTHTITATYSGDATFATSSGSVSQQVNKADTSTSVSSSVNPAVFGQSVTFTATVSVVAPGAGTPTGTVTFFGGGSPIDSGTLSGGVATLTTSALAVGNHTITTSYGGDGNVNGSTGSLTGNPQVVNKADTTTTVTSSVNPSVFGRSVTFTATVSPVAPGTGTPTGSVTFVDGGFPFGTGTLSGGIATFTTSALTAGNHTITTSYSGDGNVNGSTGSLTGNPQVVNKADTTTTVTSSLNPAPVGQSVTFTATVSPVAPGAGTPTGTVTFSDGGHLIDTGTLSSGVATLTTSSLAAGSHTITATYSGEPNFNTSNGSVTQTVNGPAAITSADHVTFTVGTTNTFTVTTTGFPFPTLTETSIQPTSLPAGVTFHDNGNGTATLSGTPAAGTGGTYTLTITAHNGIGPDTSQTFTLTVNEAPAITSASQVTFFVGVTNTVTVTTRGFPHPALTESGSLPSGVSFHDNGNGTATISGTPAVGTSGSSPLTLTASNGVGTPTTQSFSLTVTKQSTTITLTSSSNPSAVGQMVTFTATVTAAVGTPTGWVSFSYQNNGTTVVAFAAVVNGVATFSTSSLSAGTHTVTATYTGSSLFVTSTSTSLSQQVS